MINISPDTPDVHRIVPLKLLEEFSLRHLTQGVQYDQHQLLPVNSFLCKMNGEKTRKIVLGVVDHIRRFSREELLDKDGSY